MKNKPPLKILQKPKHILPVAARPAPMLRSILMAVMLLLKFFLSGCHPTVTHHDHDDHDDTPSAAASPSHGDSDTIMILLRIPGRVRLKVG
eukprot:1314203-Rhodomonas_salina.3